MFKNKSKKLEGGRLVNRRKCMAKNDEKKRRREKRRKQRRRMGWGEFLDIHQGEGSYFVLFSENGNKK